MYKMKGRGGDKHRDPENAQHIYYRKQTKKYRARQYYKCKRAISINYLNGEGFIGAELESLDRHVISAQCDLINPHQDKEHDSNFKYPTSLYEIQKRQIANNVSESLNTTITQNYITIDPRNSSSF